MIVLVQCTAAKRDEPAQAKNLYTSDLFKAQRRYAEAVADEWYILSAKHGLVDPREVLDPYDANMSDVNSQRWAYYVAATLGTRSDTIKITAGSDYADPLVPVLEERGLEVHEPFRGLRIGSRIKAMKEAVHKQENYNLGSYEA